MERRLEARFRVASLSSFYIFSTCSILFPLRSNIRNCPKLSSPSILPIRLLARFKVTNLDKCPRFSILPIILLFRYRVLMFAYGSRLAML